MTTTLLQGDNRVLLPTLPAGSVQCVVTSPPYWGLRDYGVAGQLGLEATPDEYVANLTAIFREVWRVLRDDGTLWLNLGDTYAGSWGAMSYAKGDIAMRRFGGDGEKVARPVSSRLSGDLKPKDLVGIPWMVAFALRADGWYLRSDIIWAKPNPMPESVTDRPTKAHEYLFLLSKRERYYYDAAAIAETITNPRPPRVFGRKIYQEAQEKDGHNGARKIAIETGQGTDTSMGNHYGRVFGDGPTRNRRTVWTVATMPYKGAHFATFPEKLIEPCILAGSATRACEVCGAAWERTVEKETHFEGGSGRAGRSAEDANANGKWAGQQYGKNIKLGPVVSTTTTGWQPTCACPNEGTARSIVLDPFVGSGTTCRVAERFGRDSIGIDLGYTELQEQRTNGVQKVMTDLL